MANKQRQMVELELDKSRNIRYDLNAFAEIEDKLGITMAELPDVKVGMKTIRTLLWAGLIHEDENLTESAVGKLVDPDNLKYVQEKVVEAFSLVNRKN
jgi:hypothetical protein